jgi:hypothetical protein
MKPIEIVLKIKRSEERGYYTIYAKNKGKRDIHPKGKAMRKMVKNLLVGKVEAYFIGIFYPKTGELSLDPTREMSKKDY